MTYVHTHNEANGENNADGNNDNRSTNCGIEGPAADDTVNTMRARLRRSLMATLLLAQGVPMLVAGDEMGRTQAGNNNAYCQDNALSWIDWRGAERTMNDYVARLIRLRFAHFALRRDKWLDGSLTPVGDQDIKWLWRDAREMTREHWEDRANRCFGLRLGRNCTREAALLVLMNAGSDDIDFTLPAAPGADWSVELDSITADGAPVGSGFASNQVTVPSHGLLVLVSRSQTA